MSVCGWKEGNGTHKGNYQSSTSRHFLVEAFMKQWTWMLL